MGPQAVVALPEHIDVSNAGQIREQLLLVINSGAATLIADMTATVSSDHAGADAVARAHQRAAVSGAQLRLVATAPIVRRVLSLSGLDRLVSIYPSLEAAIAAGTPAAEVPLEPGPAKTEADDQAPRRRGARARRQQQAAGPPNEPRAAAITPAVLWKLVDALHDGGGADRRRWRTRAGQPAAGGHVRLRARRTGRPAGRIPHPRRPPGGAPQPPGRLRAGTQGAADGRRGTARRAAQGRRDVPSRDQPQPGADRDRAPGPRCGPGCHRGPAARGPCGSRGPLSWQSSHTADRNCSTRSRPASITSVSACRAPSTCLLTWPGNASGKLSSAWTTRSVRSATMHSPPATRGAGPIAHRLTVIGDVSASLAESARVKQGSAKINLDAVSWSSPVGLECTIGAVTCFFLCQGGAVRRRYGVWCRGRGSGI